MNKLQILARKFAQQLEAFEAEQEDNVTELDTLVARFKNLYRKDAYLPYVTDNNAYIEGSNYIMTIDISCEPENIPSDIVFQNENNVGNDGASKAAELSSLEFYDLIKSLTNDLRNAFQNGIVSVTESYFEQSKQSRMAREIKVTVPMAFA